MIIQPVINGVVAKTAHPEGCKKALQQQIDCARNTPQQNHGFKKVLILGASSGFGLASRIALAFGGSAADTIGVSFERGPAPGRQPPATGSAGWYNNIYFREAAEAAGLIGKNFVGDAFSSELRQQVVDFIKNEFGGKLDLVIYSLASGVRPDPKTGQLIRSSIKTIGEPVDGFAVDLQHDQLIAATLPSANQQEIDDTVSVMGGEDWQSWIEQLLAEDLLAENSRTLAYSYVGSPLTHRIYHQGTLGRAKDHLHQTAEQLDQLLQSRVAGHAQVAICKALVTKASVFIPGFSPYMMALFKVMKQQQLHESCIEHMLRLFGQKITSTDVFLRLDDWELKPQVQAEVAEILQQLTCDNFAEITDYAGFKSDFLKLNGFDFSAIDYQQDIDLLELKKTIP